VRRFWKYNGLSVTLTALFLLFWLAQAISGWHVFNDDQALHKADSVSFTAYLTSGHFWQATGENWESEFLQMAAYVILTRFLFQKGSAESNDPDAPDNPVNDKRAMQAGFLYRNSLSLAFIALFGLSFILHANGGLGEENRERIEMGLPPASMSGFLKSSEFWFQSFQNWQSEFLAVLSIVVFSIFLRQHGSPESKEVGDSNAKTGC
jgi:Domain of unknown function (DUF6766)